MGGVDGFNISPKKLEVEPTNISPYYIIGMAFQTEERNLVCNLHLQASEISLNPGLFDQK